MLRPGEEQAYGRRDGVGQPGPVQQRQEQQTQHHQGQDIQNHHQGLGEIPEKQVGSIDTGGKIQADQAQGGAAQAEEDQGQGQGMGSGLGLGQGDHLVGWDKVLLLVGSSQ